MDTHVNLLDSDRDTKTNTSSVYKKVIRGPGAHLFSHGDKVMLNTFKEWSNFRTQKQNSQCNTGSNTNANYQSFACPKLPICEIKQVLFFPCTESLTMLEEGVFCSSSYSSFTDSENKKL